MKCTKIPLQLLNLSLYFMSVFSHTTSLANKLPYRHSKPYKLLIYRYIS